MASELEAIVAYHDEEPQRAAAAIRELSRKGVTPEEAPRFVWLVNHVIGEKERCWSEALRLGSAAASRIEPASRQVLRNLAVAAVLSGDVIAALRWRSRLAESTGAPSASADVAVWLGALASTIEAGVEESACEAFCNLVREADALAQGPLDDLCAASMNNFVSAAIESDAPLSSPMATAIEEGAVACRKLWARAGTWVNEERAVYLCALAFARLGKHAEAREAALRGLKIIESGGPQEVDQAFLLLELAHASGSLRLADESRTALERAHAIARRWTDQGLRDWFGRQSAKRGLPPLA